MSTSCPPLSPLSSHRRPTLALFARADRYFVRCQIYWLERVGSVLMPRGSWMQSVHNYKHKRPQFSLRNEGDNAAITMILIFCTGMKLFHEIFHAGADSHVHHNHTQSEPKAWKPGRDVPPGCRGGRHIHLSSQYPRVLYQISLQCSFVFVMEPTVE